MAVTSQASNENGCRPGGALGVARVLAVRMHDCYDARGRRGRSCAKEDIHSQAEAHFNLERILMSRVPLSSKVLVAGIAVGVGLLHFATGQGYRGPLRPFVTGHLINILLPFAMYLVLGIADYAVLRSRTARGAFVFGVGALTETMQYFGVPIFGRTFDPLDYLMFGIGVMGAAIFEWAVLSRLPRQAPE